MITVEEFNAVCEEYGLVKRYTSDNPKMGYWVSDYPVKWPNGTVDSFEVAEWSIKYDRPYVFFEYNQYLYDAYKPVTVKQLRHDLDIAMEFVRRERKKFINEYINEILDNLD